MRVGDVLGGRGEDVEDEPAVSRRQTTGHGPKGQAPVLVRLHVEQRAERADDERERLVDRRVAHVAVAQVELDARQRGALARHLEHPGRQVDADDADARRGDRHRDPARADAELEHRPARAHRLVDVERHVLDDAPRPRVVDPGDLVVRATRSYPSTDGRHTRAAV